jgi:uncharacterized cupredoxin-like copper-binding protein
LHRLRQEPPTRCDDRLRESAVNNTTYVWSAPRWVGHGEGVHRRIVLIGLVAAAAVPAAISRAGTESPASLRADIAEWSVVPSAGMVRSGLVRITARNLGYETHELVLVRTKGFADVLQLEGDHATGRPLAAPLVVAPGRSRSMVTRLRPGNYLLIDNLPWHYWRGTYAAIVVRPSSAG